MQTSSQFPIGSLHLPEIITHRHIAAALEVLQTFPEQLKRVSLQISEEKLDTPYREGSWTIRQLIHHIADSHNHCYNRIRWTLTEDSPTIKAYNQDGYAALTDYQKTPIAWSITHLEVLHKKIVYIFSTLDEQQWNRFFIHPETSKKVSVKQMALTYAWHSNHHLAHIKNALKP